MSGNMDFGNILVRRKTIGVWSSNFHKNILDFIDTSNSDIHIVRRYQFGSNVSIIRRLRQIYTIAKALVIKNYNILTPDSNCNISKILLFISYISNNQDKFIVYPDGYQTSIPLKNFTNKKRFKYGMEKNLINEALVSQKKIDNINFGKFKEWKLISIKRPACATKYEAIQITSELIGHAVQEIEDQNNDCLYKQNIILLLHPNFPDNWLKKILKKTKFLELDAAIRKEQTNIKICKLKDICIEQIESIHTVPSTLIWEIMSVRKGMTTFINLYNFSKLTRKSFVKFESIYQKASKELDNSNNCSLINEKKYDRFNYAQWKIN